MRDRSWMEVAERQQNANIMAALPQQQLNFSTKRVGWTFKGMEFLAYPPPGYEWDARLIKAIQDVFPDFQPFWVNYVYLSPPEEGSSNRHYEVFGRHGIGRFIDCAHRPILPIPVKMPYRRPGYSWGFKMRPVTKIEDVMRGAADPRALDLPGAYMKFEPWLLNFLKENWKEWSPKEIRAKYQADEDAYYEQIEKTNREQTEYVASFKKDFQKALDNASEGEIKEYFLGSKEAPKVPQVQVPEGLPHSGESDSNVSTTTHA